MTVLANKSILPPSLNMLVQLLALLPLALATPLLPRASTTTNSTASSTTAAGFPTATIYPSTANCSAVEIVGIFNAPVEQNQYLGVLFAVPRESLSSPRISITHSFNLQLSTTFDSPPPSRQSITRPSQLRLSPRDALRQRLGPSLSRPARARIASCSTCTRRRSTGTLDRRSR